MNFALPSPGPALADKRFVEPLEGVDMTYRPWEKHLRMAIVLSAVAFAIAVFCNEMAGSALAAVALFVALRPLFLKHRRAGR